MYLKYYLNTVLDLGIDQNTVNIDLWLMVLRAKKFYVLTTTESRVKI